MNALEALLTEGQAGDWLNEQVARLMMADLLPAAAAWRIVTRRIADGDRTLLASPGQTWQLREEFDSLGPWPVARRIEIQARLHGPARVVVAVETGIEHTLPVSALNMFELVGWRWQR